jgi:hypothetical protein
MLLVPGVVGRRKIAKYDLVTRRLEALYRELTRPVKRIRITEPVFWDGAQRRAGDILNASVQNGVTIGPMRTQVVLGGLKRIPQFVEMAEENTQAATIAMAPAPVAQPAPAAAVPPAPTPSPGTFADATATILKPAPAKPTGSLAARIRSLTSRKTKFQDLIAPLVAQTEETMTSIEATGPDILKRAAASAHDDLTAITDLDSAMKELAASNGPLPS